MSAAAPTCLGLIETNFLSITALVADRAVKTADVRLLGFEPTGTEAIMIRIGGDDIGSVRAALDAAVEEAERLGSSAITTLLAMPDDAIHALNHGPVATNGLYGGREEMRPATTSTTTENPMSTPQKAIGIIETQGLTAILEATDTMLKAADVRLVGEKLRQAAPVGQVAFYEGRSWMHRAAVALIEVVQHDHLMPRVDQLRSGDAADVARAAGDQKLHLENSNGVLVMGRVAAAFSPWRGS